MPLEAKSGKLPVWPVGIPAPSNLFLSSPFGINTLLLIEAPDLEVCLAVMQ